MYKVETHNNSKKYFEEIVIEEDSFYIASTTTLRAVLNKERKKLEKDVWRVIDIENFNKLIYKQWNYSINQLKIKNVIRKIIIQLKSEISDKNLIKELTYFEDNIDILHNDIRNFVQCNIKTLEYNNYSPMKYLLKKIYTEVLLTEEFKSISSEMFNIDEIKNFFKNIEGYDGGKINKIYFYNINTIDLNRWIIIELLNIAGFEIIFRIPYFEQLKAVNKNWDMLYKNNNLFNLSITSSDGLNDINSKYIDYLEGNDYQDRKDEKVIVKTYEEVSDFKREFNQRQGKNKEKRKVITFYKDSLGGCIDKEDITLEHCAQSAVGRFLINLYKCKVKDFTVYMDFNLYRELITSGWIEYKEWNGVRLSEYLLKNEDYFNGVKTIDEIIERINSLKDLEEINEIFEEQVKLRIKKDKQKRFLSNPFRAFGYNNPEEYNITFNYMLMVTTKLKKFIFKAFEGKDGLINMDNHFEMLKYAFRNNYIINLSKEGAELQKRIVRKIWGVLNNHRDFPKEMHRDDIGELFNIILNFKNDVEQNKEQDYAIDQLEGIILRDRIVEQDGRRAIYLSDLSFKANDEYRKMKYSRDSLLKSEDLEEIINSSLQGRHKELIKNGLELEEISRKSTESYLKFSIANLFINFNGVKEFSWIAGLRQDDSKSIILKQIETIYGSTNEVKQGLSENEKIYEEQLKEKKFYVYDIKELTKKYSSYSEVSYRDLDFYENKFLYTSILNSYPMYYSDFHNKLVFSNIVSILKNSIDDSYSNMSKFLFPLFPQWKKVVKQNILTCEYGRKSIMSNYKYFDGINYPKNMDTMYLLKSKYIVGENWKIKNRYNKGNFKSEDYYSTFLKDYINEDEYNNGNHCMMCPHIYVCRKGMFIIDNK